MWVAGALLGLLPSKEGIAQRRRPRVPYRRSKARFG